MRTIPMIATATAWLCLIAVAAKAGEHVPPYTHVRSGDPVGTWLIDAGATYSSTIRQALTELEESDVVAYVVIDPLMWRTAGGKIAFVGTTAGTRYVIITLMPDTPVRSLVLLGHELTHAVEIAHDPAIVDASSMAEVYLVEGVTKGMRGGRAIVDTPAAVAAAGRVERELRGRSAFLETTLAEVKQRMAKGSSR